MAEKRPPWREYLTDKSVAGAKPREGKADDVLWDVAVVGFGLRMQASKTAQLRGKPLLRKTWIVQKRLYYTFDESGKRTGAKWIKRRLGSYPNMGLGKARERAQEALGHVEAGDDPTIARNKQVQADSTTLGRVVEAYLAYQEQRRPKSHAWYRSRLSAPGVRALYRKPIRDISKRDIRTALNSVDARKHPVTANRNYGALRALFRWAISAEYLAESPVVGAWAPVEEDSRDRVLDPHELAAVWRAAELKNAGVFGPMVRMLILTGQRLREVSDMEWSELSGLDGPAPTWTIPGARAKNKSTHLVPLSPLAVRVLRSVPRVGDRYVFTVRGENPFSGFSKAKRKLIRDSHTANWRLHDLRRTVATGLQKLGFPIEVASAVLNHKGPTFTGVTAVYAKHTYAEEKRAALIAWAARVGEICEPILD